MDGWTTDLSIVTATGIVTQCYPSWAPAGVNPAVATTGQLIRKPCEGQIESLQCYTDGTHAFTLELYDLNGIDLGVDVSSATTITDAVLDAAITAGKARLIFKQNIDGAGLTPMAPFGPVGIVKGIAARAVAGAAVGTCTLNMKVHGCFRLLESAGV